MNKKHISLLILLTIIQIQPVTHAATFCATSSFELQGYLSIAQSNGQSDLIKIAVGTYVAPMDVNGFDFINVPNEDFELEISGGWSSFFGDDCGEQKPTTSPFSTILEGNADRRILTIKMVNGGSLTVSNLFFNRGFSEGVGAGFEVIGALNNNILIESNIFANNSAENGSAINIYNQTKTIIRNNLIINNHNSDGAAVDFDTGLPQGLTLDGIYFTNNTVVSNTNFNLLPDSCAGVEISVHNGAQAFIANNILWDNDQNDLNLPGFGYSYVKNNNIGSKIGFTWEESGNIYESPQFEIGGFAYILSPSSPLINAGTKPPVFISIPPNFDETWVLGDVDVHKDTRVVNGIVDIGAYESPYMADPMFKNSFEN